MKVILNSIYPFAFFILLLIIPFDEYLRALPNILLIILVIAFPFVVTKQDFLKLKNKGGLLFFVMFIFIILNTLILNRWDDNFYIIKKILISVALVIFYLPVEDFKKINKAIIFSSLLAILFSIYHIIILINETGTFEFGDSQNPLDTLLVDRLYLGLLGVMSILVSYKEMTKKYSSKNKYYLTNIVVNIVFIFVIVSKIAIITLVCLALLSLFYLTNKKVVWVVIPTVLLVFVLAFLLNDNLKQRFTYATPNSDKFTYVENMMLREPRTKIWECSYLIAKEENTWFNGLGFRTTNDKLIDCYDNNIENEGRRQWFMLKKFNTHNQFIDLYLSTGVIGFLIFCSLFSVAFYNNRKEFFPSAILVTIVLFSFVESYFHRQIGAYYFGIVLIYLVFSLNSTSKEDKLT